MRSGKNYKTPRRGNGDGCSYVYGVKAGVEIIGGGLVALTATGLAVPSGHADGVSIAGVAEAYADNRTGLDRAKSVTAMRGVFSLHMNDETAASVGKPVYAVNGDEVSIASTGGRLAAGILDGIDAEGSWVRV